MKQRCYNPKAPKFKNHGGRGITVCERWRNSFEAFLEDMGECPPGLSIDRWPDRDGNYEPGNCRWATDSEQNRNSRRNIVLSVQGRTGCLVELCEHFGLDYNFVYGRLRIGWPAEAAFFIPKMSKHESGKCRWRV